MSEIARDAFVRFAEKCPYRLVSPVIPRRGNVIALEIIQPLDRCQLKKPAHWPESASALRWIGSGGDVLVFGHCSQACALGRRWCQSCGHFTDLHNWVRSGCIVAFCACEEPCNPSTPPQGTVTPPQE